MNILVTGGAGYIGSFMTRELIKRGFSVVVFDSLERGHEEAIDRRAEFVKGDITNSDDVEMLFSNRQFDAVLHFAGLISVEESEREPDKYIRVNVEGSQNLFSKARAVGNVKNFIFSSTAAVYGNPENVPISESHSKNPTSKYGETKLSTEKNLEEMRRADDSVSFACLRYFNACGAALDGSNGEAHDPETHIIPLGIRAAIKNSEFKLYGRDYNTSDGTCVRDYIHVLDLVEAHVLALEKIMKDRGGYFYNVGTGRGYSNLEVIEMIKKVSGKDLKIKDAERRAGDASQLVADPSKINSELNFLPKYSDLETIVESAWKWHTRKQ